jgi:maltose alpha-D-glucosyltransferase / alpha-amylase
VNNFEVNLESAALRKSIPEDVWIRFLAKQRWFAGKGRTIASVHPVASCPVDSALAVVIIRVGYPSEFEDYVIPLLVGSGEETSDVVAWVNGRPLLDALAYSEGWRRLVGVFAQSSVPGHKLALRTEILGGRLPASESVHLGPADQSNSWAVVGGLFVKAYRRLMTGENLDVSVGRFLTLRKAPNTPVLRGVLVGKGAWGDATLLSVQEAVVNRGTGWAFACEQVAQVARNGFISYEPWTLLGRRLAELHKILASEGDDAPGTVRLATPDLDAVAREAQAMARSSLAELGAAVLAPDAAAQAVALKTKTSRLMNRLKAPHLPADSCHRQRIHGDLHLGQVLWDGADFTIIDFEGEPARAYEERLRKHSVAKDLAGMLRSFDYAARAGLPDDADVDLRQHARIWRNLARNAFRQGYEEAIGAEPFLPSDRDLREALIALYELEKAFYELHYELGHRPDWVGIPLAGLLDLAADAPVRKRASRPGK